MQLNERDCSILEHILNYCKEIDGYLDRFGDDFDIFSKDKAYKAACSLNILQMRMECKIMMN